MGKCNKKLVPLEANFTVHEKIGSYEKVMKLIRNLWSYSLVLHKHRNDQTSILCLCIQTIARTLTSLPVQVWFES